MSTITLRQAIAQPMLDALSSKANETLRKEAQKTGRAQVLQLENLEFINDTIRSLIESDSDKANRNLKTVEFDNENIAAAKELAVKKQNSFVKARKVSSVTETIEWQLLRDKRPDLAAQILFGNAFLVISFNVLRQLKKDIVKATVKKSEGVLKRIYSKIDRGHGAQGGDAISHLSIASGQAAARKQGIDIAKIPGFEEYLVNSFNENEIDISNVQIIKNLLIDYNQLVTATGLQDTYIPVVSFQDFLANRGVDAQTEKILLQTMRDFIESKIGTEIVNIKGSPSMKDRIEAKIVSEIAGKRKVKGKKITPPKSKKKPSISAKNTSKAGGTIKNRKGKKPSIQKTRAKKSNISIPKLLGVLNQQLPRIVAKNMRSPRLNYRTGRFASSVEVTDIIPTAKGFPSIGYTYDKYPYQTFEPGYRQGSIDKDPRKLIDASIREIAAQFALGRFYTRRV